MKKVKIISTENNAVTIARPEDFHLTHIFECGQCFRWNRIDEEDSRENEADQLSYSGMALGRSMTVTQTRDEVIFDPCTEKEFLDIWYDYFDLDRDYGSIKKTLGEGDPVMQRAAEYGYGIRILHQDLWETIVSFIISQNSNIPRIKGCIERLCQVAADETRTTPLRGSEAAQETESQYPFPSPEQVAALSEEDLAPVRLGYRQKYIMKVAEEVLDRGMPDSEEGLLDLTGVGPKVAACISLFGLGNTESFPIDVWVKKVMNQLYGFSENDVKGMRRYAEENFGSLGGFAQQYLFYYMRSTST